MQIVEPVIKPINKVIINLHKSAAEISKVLNQSKYQLISKLAFEESIEDTAQRIKGNYPDSTFYNLPEPASTSKKADKEAEIPHDVINKFRIELNETIESDIRRFDLITDSARKNFNNAQMALTNEIKTITDIYLQDRRAFENLNFPKEAFNALSDIFLVIADTVLRITNIPIKYETYNTERENQSKTLVRIFYPAPYELFHGMSFFFKNLASRSQSVSHS